jgi:hypothetical protein
MSLLFAVVVVCRTFKATTRSRAAFIVIPEARAVM